MKKAILLLTLTACFCTCLKAQDKPKAVQQKADTTKAKYIKGILVPVDEYYQLVGLVANYRTLTTYNPNMAPQERLNEQAGVDHFLSDLAKRFKVDSIKVTKP